MAGYLLHEDCYRFVALVCPGRNRKTQGMYATYTMLRDVHPVDAWHNGMDIWTCLDCAQRPSLDGGCYVDPRALASIYSAYRRGVYAPVTWTHAADILEDELCRLGGFGELPGIVRPENVGLMLSKARGWTGYTHAWKYCDPAWSRYLMASCDSVPDYAKAIAKGWRAYLVTPGPSCGVSGVVRCPAYRGRTCAECLLCAGTAKNAKSVFNPVHGFRARAALRVVAS